MSQNKYVAMSDKRYDEIVEGISKSYKNSCVLWIEEVDNCVLEEAYQIQKRELQSLRGDRSITELSVYHGTQENVARIIIKEGFDPTVNRKSAYGKGTYFARDASYSKDYSPPSSANDISYMLICKMILGKTKTYGSNETIDTRIHDNSVDQSGSIYVTPYQFGAVPQYLVAFYKNV